MVTAERTGWRGELEQDYEGGCGLESNIKRIQQEVHTDQKEIESLQHSDKAR